MTGDVRQQVTQLGFGVDTIRLGFADQRVDCCSAFASAVGAREEVVATPNGDATQGVFGGRVIKLDGAIIAVTQQRRPQLERVQDSGRPV